jgi:predicted metal-dependent HD superfamily phosphohydrolase
VFQRDQLIPALVGVGARLQHDVYDDLAEAYAEPSRHYHDQSHISECLQQLERFRHVAARPHEIAIAIWFHDAVYDTRRDDNEEESAAWAHRYLSAEGVDAGAVGRITDMIIGTKTHVVAGLDAALMVDIDLGILGAPSAAFERYDVAIRREYAWVPEEQYLAGRRAVLQGFADRDRIYTTPELHGHYEERARENLFRKLRELGA